MKILCSNNPLDLSSFEDFQVPDQITPNQSIDVLSLLGRKLTGAFILLVDGEAWGRDCWDNILPEGSLVVFVEIPKGWAAFFAVLSLVAVGASVFMASMLAPTETNDRGQAKTVYSFSSGRNRLRIGEPFAENFGRTRIFPDIAQQSYIQNAGNNQYMYFLGIIGVGEYSVEGVYIDNTPLTDYASSSYSILAPGDTPSIVPDIVWTSDEVSNQEIQDSYLVYTVSAIDTVAYFIEYDVSFPAGLVAYDKEGNRRNTKVRVVADARTIDKTGAATSDWEPLDDHVFVEDSKNPLRYSRKKAVPFGPGRYQIRVKRATLSSSGSLILGQLTSASSNISDKAVLSGLRAYGGPHPDYGDVTMIEAVIKASDQLNGDASSRINVVATRKLYPVTATGFGGDAHGYPVHSRRLRLYCDR